MHICYTEDTYCTVQCYSTSSSCQTLKNDILVSAVVLLLLPPHPHGHICTQRQVQLQYTNVHSLCMLSFLLDLWLFCTPKYKLIMMEAYTLYCWYTVNFVRTQTHMCLISIPSPLSSFFFLSMHLFINVQWSLSRSTSCGCIQRGSAANQWLPNSWSTHNVNGICMGQ